MVKKFLVVGFLVVIVGLIIYETNILVNKNHSEIKEPVIWTNIKKEKIEEPTTEIIFVGDIMLGRSVMSKSLSFNDYNYPFLKVADVLKKADLTVGNLENPITENCPIINGGFTFCTKKEMISGLEMAGIDMVSLANNHTNNFGSEGLIQTQKFLKEKNIDYFGLNNLAIKNINNIKFGLLGFDYVFQNPKESDYELIRNSKKQVDILIVMPHWGIEYKAKSNENQQKIAKNMIESGADVIVGGHPHWVQEIGYINEKPVIYSLGNFVFDQAWSEETKKGLAVRLNYKGKKLETIDQMPIYMKNFAQPEWVE